MDILETTQLLAWWYRPSRATLDFIKRVLTFKLANNGFSACFVLNYDEKITRNLNVRL